jgi:tRNA1(Val) A37 N6-methylase TrmN6
VADAAHYLLGSHGRLYLVFKAERASEVLTTLTSRKIEPKRLRFVHPKPGRRASVFLVDSIRGGRPGLVVEPPLFIEKEEGGYTEDFLRAYTKEGLSCPSR